MRGLLVVLAVVCAVCFFRGGVARAQCEGRYVDGPSQTLPGVNGTVFTTVNWDPDGSGPIGEWLVVAGSFNAAGASLAGNIAAWDGTQWHSIGTGATGPVTELAVVNGTLYALGQFSAGTSITSLRRWNGSAWVDLFEVSGRIAALNNELIVAQSNLVLAYNGSTTRTLGTAPAGTPHRLVVQGGELYYSTGRLQTVSRWNGTVWQALPTTMTGSVVAMAASPVGLVVGVTLDYPWNNLRVLRWDGAAWQAIGTSQNLSQYPSWLGTVGGSLYCCSGSSAIQRWNGSAWESGAFISGATALTEYMGSVVASGASLVTNDCHYCGLARLENGAWLPIGEGLLGGGSGNFAVNAAASNGGALYLGGSLANSGAIEDQSRGVGRFVGGQWESIGAGLSGLRIVKDLVADGNGVVAAGWFSDASGGPSRSVARWDAGAWTFFGAGLGSNTSEWAEAICTWEGRLYAGGRFSVSGTRPVRNIAAWNGVEWMEVGSGFNEAVYALTPFNGMLVAAGNFSRSGEGVQLDHIAVLDGGDWHPLGDGFDGYVLALCVFNGELYAGGSFTHSGTTPTAGVARWDVAHWVAVGADISAPSGTTSVSALTVHAGSLYAAGTRSATRFLRRWNGLAWQNTPAMAQEGGVAQLVEHEGDLVVVGSFHTVSGRVANGCAVYREGDRNRIVQQPHLTALPNYTNGVMGVDCVSEVRMAGQFSYAWVRDGVADNWTALATGGTPPTDYALTVRAPLFATHGSTYSLTIRDDCGTFVSEQLVIDFRAPCSPSDIGSVGGLEGPDHRLNNNDLVVFINWFFAGDTRADVSAAESGVPDGLLDNNDFIGFIETFFAGCEW